MNVTSCSTLGKYLATGMPVVERTITVDGDACAKPQNLIVPVGTAYRGRLNAAGLKRRELGKVVAGGAMMGPAVENLSYPTTKTTSGLIMLSAVLQSPRRSTPASAAAAAWSTAPWVWSPWRSTRLTLPAMSGAGQAACDYCFNCGSCTLSARQSALHPDDGPGKGVLPW